MKQRKFRKLFWCWTYPKDERFERLNIFMRAHKRKVKL